MSADGFLIDAETALLDTLLEALRADADIQSAFGSPARLYDDETRSPVYPYAYVDQFQTEVLGSARHSESEHRITFVIHSRYGGRQEAKALIGAFRAALDHLSLQPPGQSVVLCHTVYSDTLRSSDLRSFRSLIRVRIITEREHI